MARAVGARAPVGRRPEARAGARRAQPCMPVHLPKPARTLQRRLVQGDGQPHQCEAPGAERAGPRGHRNLPAEGRKESGFDRAHRRHQLPQDRRVRLRLRPAGVQLRRRVQHRQPRHDRVHRGAQARRRVPLRPARSDPRAQNQAEKVRSNRY